MDWRQLYPFAPHFTTTPDGFKMHFVSEGSGPTMLMLHGNPTWSFMYRDVIKAAAANGYRALAPDMLGCGLSDKPQNWPYHLENHIQNLEHWLDDELKLPEVTLVMHDWGGAIGMGYAVRHPDKVKRIVLMNTAAYISDDCPKRIYLCRCPLFGTLFIRGFNLFVEAAIRMAPATKLPRAVCNGYRFPYRNWHDRIATLRFVQDIPLSTNHPTWNTLHDIETRLPLLSEKPVTLIWGARDFCFHTGFLKRWQQIFPNAITHCFENAAHYLLEDAGQQIIPIITTAK